MFYLIWISILIILTALWAYMARTVNLNPKSYLFYVLFLAIPVWPFVSKFSKNILFDGLLYDIIMTLTYAVVFIVMGTSNGFKLENWIGLFLTILGIILMKVN